MWLPGYSNSKSVCVSLCVLISLAHSAIVCLFSFEHHHHVGTQVGYMHKPTAMRTPKPALIHMIILSSIITI